MLNVFAVTAATILELCDRLTVDAASVMIWHQHVTGTTFTFV